MTPAGLLSSPLTCRTSARAVLNVLWSAITTTPTRAPGRPRLCRPLPRAVARARSRTTSGNPGRASRPAPPPTPLRHAGPGDQHDGFGLGQQVIERAVPADPAAVRDHIG